MDTQIKLIASRIAELRAISGKTAAEMAAVTGVGEADYLKAESGGNGFFLYVHP